MDIRGGKRTLFLSSKVRIKTMIKATQQSGWNKYSTDTHKKQTINGGMRFEVKWKDMKDTSKCCPRVTGM